MGFLCLGAITIGEVCLGPDGDRSPMGTAVGTAYELDNKMWQPVIQVDKELLNIFIETPELHQNTPKLEFEYTLDMVAETDGMFFINYLLGPEGKMKVNCLIA